MGAVVVVDASVAIKWYFDEPGSREATAVLKSSDSLHAPELMLLECDAILCTEFRRGNLKENRLAEIRQELRAAGVTVIPLEDVLDLGVATSLATRKPLYDCIYLALAELLDGTFLTADKRFGAGLERTPLAGRIRLLDGV
ncbi:MAG: type II toxin-antitoxin system VapC family toxin [Phycisphaerales bacterium]